MRALVLAIISFSALGLAGCGELTGATELSEGEALFPDALDGTSKDAAASDAAPEPALDGYYLDEPVPPTRAVIRLDRDSVPDHPMVVFVSTFTKTTLDCSLFEGEWLGKMPKGSVIHVFELGGRAVGTYSVSKVDPIPADGVFAGRTDEGVKIYDVADEGTVVVKKTDALGSTGTIRVNFRYATPDSEDLGDQWVSGDFDAIACRVK